MILPNLLDRQAGVKRGVVEKDVCQWKDTSSDLYVVARGELQILNSHLPIIIVSNEGL